MKFIQPKNKGKQKVSFCLSDDTKLLISYYSKYTQFSEEEVVDQFMLNVLEDEDFVSWLKKQRFNKRINTLLSKLNHHEKDETVNV